MNRKEYLLANGNDAACALLFFDENITHVSAFAGQDLYSLLLRGRSCRLAWIRDASLIRSPYGVAFQFFKLLTFPQ